MKAKSQFLNILRLLSYSHLSNSCKGMNKRGGGAKVAEPMNVEVGINIEDGFFLKKTSTLMQ